MPVNSREETEKRPVRLPGLDAEPATPAPKRAQARRILVVDDDEVALRVHRLHLGKRGYEVSLARSVAEAKEILCAPGSAPFDGVLTDFEMPGGTGAELIEWLQRHDGTLAAIVVSAAGRKDSVASSLRSGAVDFLEKPVQLKELEAALARAIERTRRRRELGRIEKSAREVGEIQLRALLTQGDPMPPGTLVSHLPLSGAGGDFVSVLPMPDGRSLVVLADVSGHDLRAAFISAYFQGMLRGMVCRGSPAAEVLERFNQFLACEWLQQGSLDEVPLSIALTALTLDRRAGSIGVQNHGAPGAFLLRPDGWIDSCHSGGGCPLGWFEHLASEEATVPVAQGGWLVVWTDGLEELAGLLGITPWTLAWEILVATRDGRPFAERDQAEDDILLFSLPIGVDGSLPRARPVLMGRYHGGEALDIDAIQATWERSLRRSLPALADDRMNEILICLREAVLNAILHGCGRESSRSCTVQAVLDETGRRLRFRVDDPGEGHAFDWRTYAARAESELLTEHRGLLFLNSMTETFRTERNGATLHFEMPLTPESSAVSPP